MSETHIGTLIIQKMEEKHMSNTDLARALGLTQSAITYILRKRSMDVLSLLKICNVLGHDFFQYYRAEVKATDAQGGVKQEKVFDVRDKTIDELKGKLLAAEKTLELDKRKTELLEQEVSYLKKINELLEKK